MLNCACFCHQPICGHRWVQGECRRLGDTDAPEVDPMLQRAASALRERPVLFKYCAAEVAGARHNALFQRSVPPASSMQQHSLWVMHQHDNMRSYKNGCNIVTQTAAQCGLTQFSLHTTSVTHVCPGSSGP